MMGPSLQTDTVQIARHGHVALITLNRPSARNAINPELAAALCEALAAVQDARCIVLTGADPAFCAGMDLRGGGDRKLIDAPDFMGALYRSKAPLIAAANGPAVTGGLEIALACDFVIASERARFADTHVRVGVYPGPAMVDLPRRVGIAWARQLSLTGDFIDAATALRIGLVNEVKPHEDLMPFALRLAASIAESDPALITAMRRDWSESMGPPIAEAQRLHREHAARSGYTGNTAADIARKRDALLSRSRDQRGES